MNNLTMFQLLEQQNEGKLKEEALHFIGRSINYGKLLSDINQMANVLKGMGINEGDVVTICLPNIPNAVVALYAINKIGAIANMIHPLVPTNQIIEYMKVSNSKIIFMLNMAHPKHEIALAEHGYTAILCGIADYLPKVKGVGFNFINRKKLKPIKYSKVTLCYNNLLKIDCEQVATFDKYDSCAVYLHSGGTTGTPKTIMLSQGAMNNLAMRGKSIVGMEDIVGKGMLTVLPMFHGFGLCVGVHMMLVNTGISVLIPQFDAKMICSAIKKGKISIMAGVPTLYEKLLKTKGFANKGLKKVEFVFCGGDSMPQKVKQDFDAFAIKNACAARMYEGYGLTETVTVCAVNNNEFNRDGSCGKTLEGIKVKVVDVNSGKILPPRSEGELCFCGDTVMMGYLSDVEGTKQAIKKDENGEAWVHTGDYGYVDEDDFIFFKQRLKRIIKVSGVAVFPSEIEDFAKKVDGVALACAIPVENEKTGHIVKLYVEPNNFSKADDALEQNIRKVLKDNLMHWAIPKEIVFVEKLPLTMVGKVDFKVLMKNQ